MSLYYVKETETSPFSYTHTDARISRPRNALYKGYIPSLANGFECLYGCGVGGN